MLENVCRCVDEPSVDEEFISVFATHAAVDGHAFDVFIEFINVDVIFGVFYDERIAIPPLAIVISVTAFWYLVCRWSAPVSNLVFKTAAPPCELLVTVGSHRLVDLVSAYAIIYIMRSNAFDVRLAIRGASVNIDRVGLAIREQLTLATGYADVAPVPSHRFDLEGEVHR